jgi:hypothetical protein
VGGKEGENGSTTWQFHGDFADQGLLYYWTKYYKQSVSIIHKNHVEHWSSSVSSSLPQNDRHQVLLEQTSSDTLSPYACLPYKDALNGRYAKGRFTPSWVPYRDFYHFSGNGKPWQALKRLNLEKTKTFETVQTTNPLHYWYFILRKVNTRLDMNLDFANLNIPRRANDQSYPTRSQVYEKVRAANDIAKERNRTR